jgi:hypothetical protein
MMVLSAWMVPAGRMERFLSGMLDKPGDSGARQNLSSRRDHRRRRTAAGASEEVADRVRASFPERVFSDLVVSFHRATTSFNDFFREPRIRLLRKGAGLRCVSALIPGG